MNNTFQISGAFYIALGAVICLVLGVGASKRLFQSAKKFERGKRNHAAD